jgi:hypothetical protein
MIPPSISKNRGIPRRWDVFWQCQWKPQRLWVGKPGSGYPARSRLGSRRNGDTPLQSRCKRPIPVRHIASPGRNRNAQEMFRSTHETLTAMAAIIEPAIATRGDPFMRRKAIRRYLSILGSIRDAGRVTYQKICLFFRKIGAGRMLPTGHRSGPKSCRRPIKILNTGVNSSRLNWFQDTGALVWWRYQNPYAFLMNRPAQSC